MGAKRAKRPKADLGAMAALYETLEREFQEAEMRLDDQKEAFGKALAERHGEDACVVIGGRAYRALADMFGGYEIESEPCTVYDATVDSGK